jgi:hypothetical protein
LRGDEQRENYLRLTNFIRPEDIHKVAEYFDGIMLATRVNPSPSRVLEAYMRGSYSGAVSSILEPDHSGIFYPKVIENKKIANNYLDYVLECDKNCRECGYCKKVQKDATVDIGDLA